VSLSNKQTVFIHEYLVDFNATQAAKRAGYSAKTAASIGAENLTKPEIKAAIQALIDEKVMSKDEVLTRLADIARGDVSDLMALTTAGYTLELMVRNETGDLVPNPKTKLIRKIHQKVITYLAKTADGEDREIIDTDIELYSAHDALRDIGKYHGLFVDRTDITSNGKTIRVTLAGEDDSSSD
jgi:phage terminase small subunit